MEGQESQVALAAGATVVAAAFACCLLDRWTLRRRPHELAWGGAMVLFAAGSLSLWAGTALGWEGWTFRSFYLFGAILNVPVLALGTVYLLAGPRVGHRAALGVGAVLCFAAGVMVVSPFTAPVPATSLPQGSEVLPPLPRILAAAASAGGAAVVFVGAAMSTVRLLRRRGPGRLAAGNALIAAGTLVLSGSGVLNSAFGEMGAFAASLVAGVTILFAGFLVTTSAPAPPALRILPNAA